LTRFSQVFLGITAMRDFLRDWQRWTVGERLVAAALLALMLVGITSTLALGTHLH